jgi:hypothetical protein
LATDEAYQHGPNATVIERPRDCFERRRASSSDGIDDRRKPHSNWSAAAIWISLDRGPDKNAPVK